MQKWHKLTNFMTSYHCSIWGQADLFSSSLFEMSVLTVNYRSEPVIRAHFLLFVFMCEEIPITHKPATSTRTAWSFSSLGGRANSLPNISLLKKLEDHPSSRMDDGESSHFLNSSNVLRLYASSQSFGRSTATFGKASNSRQYERTFRFSKSSTVA